MAKWSEALLARSQKDYMTKEESMAGRGAPTFKKCQKEQQTEKATGKIRSPA
jgi:hypothetical protein